MGIAVYLHAEETATILAALRYYQQHGQGSPENRSDEIHEIATGGDEGLTSLDDEGIDDLCEHLNMGDDNWQTIMAARDRLHEVLHDPDGGDLGDECDAAGNLVDALDAFRASHGDP
ncbi:TPA: hypothetical protein ACOECQ_002765 [Stenotrophomonas maltophilia]